MKFIFFTHTEYSHLWNIMLHFIEINKIDAILAINEPSDFFMDKKIQTIIYPQDTYANKVKFIISKIDDDYFVWNHDIFLMISINMNLLETLKNIMIQKNIDKISMHGYDNYTYDIITVNEQIDIVRNKDFFLYSVGPAIWKKSTLIDVMSTFSNRTYRDIENNDVQDYMNKNYIIYQICANKEDDIYHWHHYFNKNFQICQIFNGGKLVNFDLGNNKNYISDYKSLIFDYLDKNKIEINQTKSFERS